MIFIVVQIKFPVMAHPIILGKSKSNTSGFTYLVVLGLILILLLSLGVTSEHVSLTKQRELEEELIFVGKQYQRAITSYYIKSPNGFNEFPQNFESLVNDNRSLTSQHHLRKLYRDPITGSDEWGLVKNDLGQITGVFSLSKKVPIKKNIEFLKEANSTVNTYSDWKFEYIPQSIEIINLEEQIESDDGFPKDFKFYE